jgi:hypothetical protein
MSERDWATKDEKAFINRMGLNSIYGGPTSNYIKSDKYFEKRCKGLEGYIKAAKERWDWGNINADECIVYAMWKLEKLIGGK